MVSDRKIAVESSGDIDYYTADVISYSDYYPFGMEMEDRSNSAAGTRYGFNGMEKDKEYTNSNSHYDFGARTYDSRIGRWFSRDPLAVKYPGLSPFQFAANTPISAFDPDGRLIIFINGEVGELEGRFSDGSSKERASILYWGWKFTSKVTTAFNDQNYIFRDGDVGTGQTTRFDAGYTQAKTDFETILSSLKRDENGKITEAVRLVSHSKGTAYAAGYQKAWNEMMAKQDPEKFSGNGGQMEFNLMLAPHQSWAMKVESSETVTVGISHYWDPASDDGVSGDIEQVQTDNHYGANVFKTHGVDGFHFEAVAAIEQFIKNSAAEKTLSFIEALGTGSLDKYKYSGYTEAIQNARKWYWERTEYKYYGTKDDN